MIQIDDITITYDSNTILSGISLSIPAGQKIALFGPSGSGKSSILQTVLGFVTPQAGTVRIDEVELTPKSVWSLRRKIGYVPQEPDLGEGTAEEIIERPFGFHANHSIARNIEKLPQMLNQFALAETTLAKDITSLSGGEKQRVALIIALLLERPILLLDEISSALDPTSKQAVIEYLAASEQTVILVTHDPTLQTACDRVVSLNDLQRRGISQ